MEQLIAHLLGDYIFQSDKMARLKVINGWYTFIHCIVYGSVFVILIPGISSNAILAITITHFFIDRFRLAKYVSFFKNKIHDTTLMWEDCKETGYPRTVPKWMAVWLMIIVDNTMHITINYLAITYL